MSYACVTPEGQLRVCDSRALAVILSEDGKVKETDLPPFNGIGKIDTWCPDVNSQKHLRQMAYLHRK